MNTEQASYLERLQNILKDSSEKHELLGQFAATLWARTPQEDLAQRDPQDDAGATLAAWRHLVNRPANEISFHLLNPVAARDGWHSPHSVVIVAAPNMPFMVDSVLMALSHDGLVTHHLNNVVLGIDRDQAGGVTGISPDLQHPHRELLIHAEIDRLEDDALPRVQTALQQMARELRAVVDDFGPMKARVESIVASLQSAPPPVSQDEIDEAIAFLRWLLVNHFTFLGCREFTYADGTIRQVGESLGLHRIRPRASERRMQDQSPRTRRFLQAGTLLSFSKSGTRSRVHRPAYPDYIGIKQFDRDGTVTGEVGLSGLYTSRVYMEFPENVPVVRRKVASVIARSGLDPAGFDGKVFAQVLATYPRDELVQIGEDELLDTALAITDIHERRRVRVFVRRDPYGLFVTTLVYMPRDLFSTVIRLRLYDLLTEVFEAEDADHDILLSESTLVRVQFNLRIRPGSQQRVDRVDLEQRISALIGDWCTDLNEALLHHFGESEGRRLRRVYSDAFAPGYRDRYSVRAAIQDIESIGTLTEALPLATRLYRHPQESSHTLRLKTFHLGPALPLSDVVPKLENLGLTVISEHPHQIDTSSDRFAVQEYELHYPDELDLSAAAPLLEQAFLRIWRQAIPDDAYNRLILRAGLDWRQVGVLRAYGQYMKQIRMGFSQNFISETLVTHAAIASALFALFDARFDPSAAAVDAAPRERIMAALEEIQLLNEDRILRRFVELIDATQRTNYYVMAEDGLPRRFLSLKLQASLISNLPEPRPMHEVFVSAAHFEGVHLRGGPVARGGIRWSDRLEDYRTEVLGLVKAQRVKNAVIVPTGAKGGFVVKSDQSPQDCYRDYIRGLLDLTDNIRGDEVLMPAGVRAWDGPDPYLVVAADKGTASFSDLANATAAEYDFWLGDAFASGGSNGYDHKKMGITARGAWVSVQRHFAERGIDLRTASVTVLGIGDMGGDVFGNGMLLSDRIALVAAFNHRHIFIDPNPDPAQSFAERQRLFAAPPSGWDAYDAASISAGGGVFSRTAKAIAITPQMRDRFQIDADTLTPDELIQSLLRSPVQLIWNGGIGTYVKASSESHAEANDRSNDHLRVNASELRCQVFGEGGNLGMTQPARIEFSMAGGSVNCDFIDNSAGVDCSDHEVNLKIALNDALANQDLTLKQRNALLKDMTDAVAQLVLANNARQALTISLAARDASRHPVQYERAMQYFEQHAGLNRALEYLPAEETLAARRPLKVGLTRPELSVLLAYAKIHIKQSVLGKERLAEPLLAARAQTAFPEALVEHSLINLTGHRLIGELTATQLANEIVDGMGITFVVSIKAATGAAVIDIVTAYAVVAECFGLTRWIADIRNLDGLTEQTRLNLLLDLAQLGTVAVRWLLRHGLLEQTPSQLIDRFKAPLSRLIAARDGSIGERGAAWRQQVDALTGAGLPTELAHRSAFATDLTALLPIIHTAQRGGFDLLALTAVTIEVGHRLQFDLLAAKLRELSADNHWQAMLRESLLDDLLFHQVNLSGLVVKHCDADLNRWLAQHSSFANHWRELMSEAQAATQPDPAMFVMMIDRLSTFSAAV